MSDGPPRDRSTSQPAITSPIVAMWALFLGVGLMMVGNGLQGTLLGVRSTLERFDTAVIGVISAGYYAGFLLGSRFTMRALGRVGHVRVFAALASVASTAALLYAIFVQPATWFAMRVVTGFCMAGLYVVAESWLNDQTTPERRGRTLSLYMFVTMGGIIGGQFLLNVADPRGFELFIIASVLVSMSLVPMALSEVSAPATEAVGTVSFRTLWSIVPTGMITMFLSGSAAGAVFAIGPVYATNIGMSTREVSVFISAALFGAMVVQIPLGSLSDRLPRRGVMLFAALGAAAASVVGVATDTGLPSTAVMFVLGATSFPLYSVSIAYTNDWIDGSQRVGASGLLVMINGIGAVIGPLVTATTMRIFSDDAYFWNLAFLHALLVVYVAYRIIARDAIPVDEQSTYEALANRGSAVAAAAVGKTGTDD